MTSLAVNSFLFVFLLLVDDGWDSELVVELLSTIGWAFLIKVFGVCGVSKSRSLRNFLCGGVLPDRFVTVLASLLLSWNETRPLVAILTI